MRTYNGNSCSQVKSYEEEKEKDIKRYNSDFNDLIAMLKGSSLKKSDLVIILKTYISELVNLL